MLIVKGSKIWENGKKWRRFDSFRGHPRISRWLTIDPVTKPHLSPYNSMSNNPIIRIDPRGSDDFFDAKGNYLGSTSTGNTIRVIPNDVNIIEAMVDVENKTMTLLQIDFSQGQNENRAMLSAIATFYVQHEGITNEKVKVQDMKEGVIAFYHPCSSQAQYPCDEDYFGLAINKESGMVHFLMDDCKNLINSFVHEQKHEDDYSTNTPVGLEHVNAVIAQSQHSSWEETTSDFRKGALQYVAIFLNYALFNPLSTYTLEQTLKVLSDVQKSPLIQKSDWELDYFEADMFSEESSKFTVQQKQKPNTNTNTNTNTNEE